MSSRFLRMAIGLVGLGLLGFGVGCKEKAKTPKVKKKAKMKVRKAASRPAPPTTITIYAGRSKRLVKPLIEKFTAATKIRVKVKYAKTAQLALLLQQEIKSGGSQADIFWSQDAGALGLLEQSKAFMTLPDDVQKLVPAHFQNPTKKWIATSGRARVLAYSPKKVRASRLPKSVFELTRRKWRGRVGWAPNNASFQAFVTAMRVAHGDKKTKKWLKAMKRNKTKNYPKNTAIVKAIAAGEIRLGLPNHYYLLRFKKKDKKYPVEQTFFKNKDIGNLVNIAGAGILSNTKKKKAALKFVRFLLSPAIQKYVTQTIFEYPMLAETKPAKHLVPLKDLMKKAPSFDLKKLRDLKGTLQLMRDAGVP